MHGCGVLHARAPRDGGQDGGRNADNGLSPQFPPRPGRTEEASLSDPELLFQAALGALRRPAEGRQSSAPGGGCVDEKLLVGLCCYWWRVAVVCLSCKPAS